MLGLVTGALSNVTSGGGGVFTIFFLNRFSSLSIQQSIATVLASSTVIVFSGAVLFQRSKAVNQQLALTFGLSGVAGAFLAARIALGLDEVILERLLGAFMILLAVYVLYGYYRRSTRLEGISGTGAKKQSETPVAAGWAGTTPLAVFAQVGLGFIVGVATGLFGVGGGAISLAILLAFFKLEGATLLGTSLVVTLFRYAGATAGYLGSSSIVLFYFALLSAGGVVGSIIGARFLLRKERSKGLIQLAIAALFFFVGFEFLLI